MEDRYLYHPLSHYGNPDKVIGKGTFGQVQKFVDGSGKEYAVKFQLGKEKGTRKIIQDPLGVAFFDETSLFGFNHPNILIPLDCGVIEIQKQNYNYLVYDLAITDLSEFQIEEDEDDPESLKKKNEIVKTFFYQMGNGVSYLTANGIFNSDIKLENSLLFPNFLVKLGDFGLSQIVKCNINQKLRPLGTPNYMAPELLLGGTDFDDKADVWSLGVSIFYCYTGFHPFEADTTEFLIYNIFRLLNFKLIDWTEAANYPKWNTMYDLKITNPDLIFDYIDDPQLRSLLEKMIVINPKNRYNIFQVLADSYFDSVQLPLIAQVNPSQPQSCKTILQNRDFKTNNYLNPDNHFNACSYIYDIARTYKTNMQVVIFAFQLLDYFVEYFKVESEDQACKTALISFILAYKQHNYLNVDNYKSLVDNFDEFLNSIYKCLKSIEYNLYRSTSYDYLNQLLNYKPNVDVVSDNNVDTPLIVLAMIYSGVESYRYSNEDLGNIALKISQNIDGELDTESRVLLRGFYSLATPLNKIWIDIETSNPGLLELLKNKI